MSEYINEIKNIYNSNNFLPSTNNICGIVTKDGVNYKCPQNKFCNIANGEVGVCQNVNCIEYRFKNFDIDISKFDGDDVSRNNMIDFCKYPKSTNGKCGLDNNNTKCPDGQCCSIKGICGYDKESCLYITPYYSNNVIPLVNRNQYSNYSDVIKFEKDYITNIRNKYIDNKFEISTDNKCGIDLENEKIVKCKNNECCTKNNVCTANYDNCNDNNTFNFHHDYHNLNSNLIHGENFNENYNKWKNDKLNANFKPTPRYNNLIIIGIVVVCIFIVILVIYFLSKKKNYINNFKNILRTSK